MKKITVAIMFFAAITGCSSVKPLYLADGRPGYLIGCGGPLKTWTSCMVTAGKLCGSSGYVNRFGNEFERRLIISCGAGATALTSQAAIR